MSDPLDKSAFLAIFKAEAEENLARLTRGLLSLEKNSQQPPVLEELFRVAHTLKGSARMMGYLDIQQIAHRLEDLFAQVQKGTLAFTPVITDAALKAVDAIGAILGAAVQGKPVTVDVSAVILGLEECLPGGSMAATSPAPSAATRAQAAGPQPAGGTPAAPPELQPAGVEEYIRIPISRVNALLNLIGELVINKVKSSYKLATLRRLTQQAKVTQRRMAQLAESAKAGAYRDAGTNGELPQLLHQCTMDTEGLKREIDVLSERLSAETVHIDPVVDELQFKVKELRMLPCTTIFEGFERLIRDTARQERKMATLEIEGEETELDKKVLEVVRPCLIHLLRNAVYHGIETPDARQASGKPQVGTIGLRAYQRSGKVVIEVQDDGQGIDVEQITRVALSQQLATPEQLGQMSEQETLNLIFAPGFTTSPIITDVAGRGVGLDAVRTDIERLKGQVRLATQPGVGTTVTIELPLTIAIMQVLLVEANGQPFGLPLLSVEETVMVQSHEVQTIEHRMAIQLRERTVPVVKLAEVLGLAAVPADEDASRPAAAGVWPVVITSSLGRPVGFMVDVVVGQEEIFVKNLGKHLGKLQNVSGAAILGTGEVIVILNVAELIQSARLTHPAVAPHAAVSERSSHRILLVEDSLTTRELERNILEGHGYAVETAVDGLDGLEKLRQGTFELVVSDIQMPRMDGFEFCRALRQNPEYRELPVVFVTTLDREEEKRRGIEVGGNAYLVKGAFDQTNLLQTIERLIG